MARTGPTIRRGRFVIPRYEFQIGGQMDILSVNFVSDPTRGLGVPARSLSVSNRAGGGGNNILYYSTSSDGTLWDDAAEVPPDTVENWSVEDNCVFSQARFWASNANLVFSLRAAPGEWTQEEFRRYVPNPAIMKESQVLETWKAYKLEI